MLIILFAIGLVQISFILTALVVFNTEPLQQQVNHLNATEIENNWHEEANAILTNPTKAVEQLFLKWKEKYPESSMFWVDGDGRLQLEIDTTEKLPANWSSVNTAQFLKSRYNGDPFTVVAFVGEKDADGFVVLELPRDLLTFQNVQEYGHFFVFMFIGIILFFIFISFLFFRSIRKRLLTLQHAMEVREVDGLPVLIDVKKKDEIGQLEQTFNKMVQELKESRHREQQEEQLRKELIANLSHDLRTPLTKIRAHLYSLGKEEELSKNGEQSVEMMDQSIQHVDQFIENLMSYTLLTANKYEYEPSKIDIVRLLRKTVASWYPLFEKEYFTIEVDFLPLQEKEWQIDPLWMERIVDNVLQNVLRHAKDGRFIQVNTVVTEKADVIVITDHGPGIHHQSNESGVGIGLSIVDMMVKEMGLDWEISSDESGTTVKISRNFKS